MVLAVAAMNVFAAAKTAPVKATAGKKYQDIGAAVKAGAVQGCAPFSEGVDFFGFYNGIDQKEAQRYADGTFKLFVSSPFDCFSSSPSLVLAATSSCPRGRQFHHVETCDAFLESTN